MGELPWIGYRGDRGGGELVYCWWWMMLACTKQMTRKIQGHWHWGLLIRILCEMLCVISTLLATRSRVRKGMPHFEPDPTSASCLTMKDARLKGIIAKSSDKENFLCSFSDYHNWESGWCDGHGPQQRSSMKRIETCPSRVAEKVVKHVEGLFRSRRKHWTGLSHLSVRFLGPQVHELCMPTVLLFQQVKPFKFLGGIWRGARASHNKGTIANNEIKVPLLLTESPSGTYFDAGDAAIGTKIVSWGGGCSNFAGLVECL